MELQVLITQKGKVFEGKAPEIIQKAIDDAMSEAVALLEAGLKKEGRIPQGVFGAQGGLLASVYGEVAGRGTPVVKGVAGLQKKYAEVIEKGRTPGKGIPPKGALVRWIEVKMGLDSKAAKKIEFVVRRSIARKGFEGRHMVKETLDENIYRIQAIFDRHGFEAARVMSEV